MCRSRFISISALFSALCVLHSSGPADAQAAAPMVLVSPQVAAQQQQAASDAAAASAPTITPLDAAPTGTGCATELACQQDMDAQAIQVEQYTQDMDVASGKSLAIQRVGFDVQLGILFVVIVTGLIVPNLLRRST